MEKIRASKIRFYTLAIVFFLILYLILYFREISVSDIEITALSVLITSMVVMLIEVTNKYKADGIYFSEKGILYILKNTKYTMEWKDLSVAKKISSKYFIKLNLATAIYHNSSFYLIIYWPTENDIIEKTKKYCPKDHELYKVVEEYAKRRGFSF